MVKFCRAVPTASPDSLLNPIPISSSPKMSYVLRYAQHVSLTYAPIGSGQLRAS